MTYKKTLTSAAFLFLGLGGLLAQESPVTAGGNATGTGGTISYSLGQVVYTTQNGPDTFIEQGLQHPFEILTLLDISDVNLNLQLSAYPNPTSHYITLKTDNSFELSYQLYDIQGRIIETNTLKNNTTRISLEKQPTATYLLKVLKNNQAIKIFKIIKN